MERWLWWLNQWSAGSGGRLTGHQQQPLGLGLHRGALAVLLVSAAVERLAGLVDHRLLHVQVAGQCLQGGVKDEEQHYNFSLD